MPDHRADIPDLSPAASSEQSVELRTNLTHSQRLIWTGQRLNGDAPLYNMAVLFHVDGTIDYERFASAFQKLIDQNDSLRTTFSEVNGVPTRHVQEQLVCSVGSLDLSSSEHPQADVITWASNASQRSFDLSEATYESVLIKLGRDQFAWYLNQHHIITDAWSTSLLFHQLATLYDHSVRGTLPESSVRPAFEDYVAFEQASRVSPQSNRSRSHWEQQARKPAPAPVFYGETSSNRAAVSTRVSCRLGTSRTLAIRSLANEPDVRALTPTLSLFNLVATLLFAYLYRISGNRDLRIGAPSHNRQLAFQETIGLMIEVLPMSLTIEESETFASLLKKVSTETQKLLLNGHAGAGSLFQGQPFEVLLNFINISFGNFCGFPTRTQWIHSGYADPGHALRLQVYDFDQKDDLALDFDLNCEAFTSDRRSLVPKHFCNLLDALLADRSQLIDRPSIITIEERSSNERLNDTEETATTCENVVQMFQRQVAASPNQIAVTCGKVRLTYAILNARANHLATALQEKGVGAESTVGLLLQRSPEAVIAILGILKAGAAFVPIDPTYPTARMQSILADAKTMVVLTHSKLVDRLPSTIGTICVDQQTDLVNEGPPDTTSPDHLAYVIYTSGSTGQPKGVEITHAALANYVSWARAKYCGDKRLAFPLFSSLSFDLTITSIFVPLASGGEIVVYPETSGQVDLAVLDVFQDNAADIVKLTPSHLRLVQNLDPIDSRIKQLVLGGEDLPRDLAARASVYLGDDLRIHNEYGPTEATVGCIVHTFDPYSDDGISVPIGQPISNMHAYVLDCHLNPVPHGVVGELYLAGAGLARGYRNREMPTNDVFVANPFRAGTRMYRTGDLARQTSASLLEFVGRNDQQVKIRGARIELGEIEATLSRHSDVRACVVVADVHSPPAPEVLVHCARCGLPSNYPNVAFDGENVCNLCRSFDAYQAKVQQYFKSMDDLRTVFDGASGRGDYDCLALLSGGKDSTYALCQLVDMGLNVLAFTLDNGYISSQAKANIRRVVSTLDVGHIFGSTEAMNAVFVDSLQRHANVCHGCFKTLYTLSTKVALEKRIPYIVTGLSRGQFFETRLTEELFTDPNIDVDQIDDMILEARKAYHRVDDAVARLLDVDVLKDDQTFVDVQFIDFYRYCSVELDAMLNYLDERVPWVRPSDTGRSTNCLINDVGIHIHKQQRGFHNYALPYSWDVRMGHKTRRDALAELDDDIDVSRVKTILSEIGYDDAGTPAKSDQQLVAYYVAEHTITSSTLRQFLRQELPDSMVPSEFVRLDSIPLTANGKVDRQALPSRHTNSRRTEAVHVEPRTKTERDLARIWQNVLRVPRVGIKDNFFELGGDSITALQIVARAIHDGMQLSPHQLFRAETIENLAPMVTDAAERPPHEDGAFEKPRAAFSLANLEGDQLGKLASALRKSDRKGTR